MTTTKRTACDAFIENMEAIRAELAELQTKVDDFFNVAPDDANWAHVGDLSRVLELLRQANGKED